MNLCVTRLGLSMWKGIRHCNRGAIILVAAAIIAGGITDVVPATTWEVRATTWEPIAGIFRDAVLLLPRVQSGRRAP